MRVLVACERSGRVRSCFRLLGHDAWSCDIEPADDGDEHHFTCDVRHYLGDGWDLIIGFPPCTDLAGSGARHWKAKQAAFQFVRTIWDSDCDRVAVENPQGWLNTNWRKPDQVIQPWMFGDPWTKRTCIWKRNLPDLTPTDVVDAVGYWVDGGGSMRAARYGQYELRRPGDRRGKRSQTFWGIAAAMAHQWGGFDD